jgi:hypothetical protein
MKAADEKMPLQRHYLRRARPIVTGLAMVLASTLALVPALAAPVGARAVVAVFPVWLSGSEAMTRAARAGDAVEPGRLPFIIIARSSRVGLSDRMLKTGALVVLNLDSAACGQGRSS